MGVLYSDKCKSMIIFHSGLLIMRSVSNIAEKINTHILCSINTWSTVYIVLKVCL